MGVTKMGTWHKISIHALREEGDMAVRAGCCCSTYFYPRPPRGGRHAERCDAPNRFKISIHALREEGDTLPSTVAMPWELFLSTPSARRATLNNSLHTDPLTENFYPRPPRGGRLDLVIGNTPFQLFLSTPSARRATKQTEAKATETAISIHALREEGDDSRRNGGQAVNNFYPRPPRGGRPGTAEKPAPYEDFYPRPPRGGRLLTRYTRPK